MRYLSVCSGIEAATVAWHPLGWEPAAFAEIEAFPSAVLKHHYPHVPNAGDFTTIKGDEYGSIDLLVGGTPCQSFSIAGLRGGLADDRGNLALEFLRLAQRARPRWLVWENVPGVLSSNDGRDFGAILGGMVELGYGFAYRVLDAQHVRVDGLERAVPQRRRRVFVVGYLGDWRGPAAVLFERESLSGHPAPRRIAGERVAPTIAARTRDGGGLGTDFDCDGGLIAFGGNRTSGPLDVATAVNAHGGPNGRCDFESETFVACVTGDITHALTTRCGGRNAGEDGTGCGTPIVPIAFSSKDHGADAINDLAPTLRAMGHAESHANAGGQLAVAFDMRGREDGSQFEGPHETANIRAASGGSSRSYVAQQWAVRRLTPRECERLQGFPDDYTLISHRGKPAADGPRYKALGNSMAVNCMRWIGTRIAGVEASLKQAEAA